MALLLRVQQRHSSDYAALRSHARPDLLAKVAACIKGAAPAKCIHAAGAAALYSRQRQAAMKVPTDSRTATL